MEKIQMIKTEDERFICDIGITTEEWISLLQNEAVADKTYIEGLAAFYREPGHKSTCAALGKKYKCSPQFFNASVRNFCQWVQKELNRFELMGTDGEETFWAIAMLGRNAKDGFEWEVRPELVSALETVLLDLLIKRYKSDVMPRGLRADNAYEIYKWDIITRCNGAGTEDILKEHLKPKMNLIDRQYDGVAISKLLVTDHDELIDCFETLKSSDLLNAFQEFKDKAYKLTEGKWQYTMGDERMAAAYLACVDPSKYTFYKSEIYEAFCKYMGYPVRAAGQKYAHYLSLLPMIVKAEKSDTELSEFMAKETEGFISSDLLIAQDILWQTKEYMKDSISGPSKHFSWIPFFKEFAGKLAGFVHDRASLLSDIGGLADEHTAYLGDSVNDICPFTTMGLFNRSGEEKRLEVIQYFKDKWSLSAPLPKDFDGIPVLQPNNSIFFADEHKPTDIDDLWNLFHMAMAGEDITDAFDYALQVKGSRWNLTIALFWADPDRFLPLDSRTKSYLEKVYGIKAPKDSELSGESYLNTLNEVKAAMADGAIKEKSFYELSFGAWEHDMSGRKYWLVGYKYDGGAEDQLARFLEGGYWEGNGTKAVNERIEQFKAGDVLILKTTSTKGKDRKLPFMRVSGLAVVTGEKAELLPDTNYRIKVQYFPIDVKDFDGKSYGQYRQTAHPCTDKAVIKYVNPFLNSDNISSIDTAMAESKQQLSVYADLLLKCRNLILTGAPGTGKTYLVKSVAAELGAKPGDDNFEMVQFHPSYDYTDFVEGYRPTEDNGFKRVDGVFKAFCKRALKNFVDSEKSKEVLRKERSMDDRLTEFLDDAITSKKEFSLYRGNKFIIESADDSAVTVSIPDNEIANSLSIQMSDIQAVLNSDIPLEKPGELHTFFGKKFNTQQDSYTFVICKHVRSMAPALEVQVEKVEKKNFVFIIDEINRGEISKIFGELFFSIEPGYRGTKGRIKTQYQNLVETNDPFAAGFYVPENVYILGTMNDIDRSVESMDFAIRRRFAWREVKPAERTAMWDGVIDSYKEEALKRMSNLNAKIADPAIGLGPEYSIGPSYFSHLQEYGGDWASLWEFHIEGLLKEYLRGNPKAADSLGKLKEAYELIEKKEVATDADTDF